MDRQSIKETARDIVEKLVPVENGDEPGSEHFAASFRLAVEAARKWQAEHGENARASINVQWDENGQPIVTVTEMERQVDDT